MSLKTLTFRAVILGLLTISSVSSVFAQHTGYSQTNLVANTAGVANHTDAQLSNPSQPLTDVCPFATSSRHQHWWPAGAGRARICRSVRLRVPRWNRHHGVHALTTV